MDEPLFTETLAVAGVPAVVLVPLLVEAAKRAGLPTRYAPLATLVAAGLVAALAEAAPVVAAARAVRPLDGGHAALGTGSERRLRDRPLPAARALDPAGMTGRALLRRVLADPLACSRLLLPERALRGYQAGPVVAGAAMVLARARGDRSGPHAQLWLFSRQSGKDEALAQFLAWLLLRFPPPGRRGGGGAPLLGTARGAGPRAAAGGAGCTAAGGAPGRAGARARGGGRAGGAGARGGALRVGRAECQRAGADRLAAPGRQRGTGHRTRPLGQRLRADGRLDRRTGALPGDALGERLAAGPRAAVSHRARAGGRAAAGLAGTLDDGGARAPGLRRPRPRADGATGGRAPVRPHRVWPGGAGWGGSALPAGAAGAGARRPSGAPGAPPGRALRAHGRRGGGRTRRALGSCATIPGPGATRPR
jgi:hypothetical protein